MSEDLTWTLPDNDGWRWMMLPNGPHCRPCLFGTHADCMNSETCECGRDSHEGHPTLTL